MRENSVQDWCSELPTAVAGVRNPLQYTELLYVQLIQHLKAQQRCNRHLPPLHLRGPTPYWQPRSWSTAAAAAILHFGEVAPPASAPSAQLALVTPRVNDMTHPTLPHPAAALLRLSSSSRASTPSSGCHWLLTANIF